MLSFEIRPYCESDRPFLRTIYLSSRRKNWHWLSGESWQLEDFDPLILGETVLVAMDGLQRAGFAAYSPVNNFLHSLFVSPEYQGKGAGQQLLRAVQQQFTATGSLKCMTKNHPAREFYRQQGWQEIATGTGEEGQYVLMHYPRHRSSSAGDAGDAAKLRGN